MFENITTKVFIHKSPSADSRTSEGQVSFGDFSRSTDMHRSDVKNLMYLIAKKIKWAGLMHDWTKKAAEEEFYKSFTAAKKDGVDFKKDSWYQYHITKERHHIKSYVAEDINLIDVLEMICDCCAAGTARSGKIYDIDIDPKVLMKAYENTVELVKSSIELVGDEQGK